MTFAIHSFEPSKAIRVLSPATLALLTMLTLAGCAGDPQSVAPEAGMQTTGAVALTPAEAEYDQLINTATNGMIAGDWRSAFVNLNRAISLAPDQPEAYYNYGRAHLSLRQYRPAERAFLKAQEVDPEYAPSWYFLARLMVIKEDLPAAYDAAQKAVELSDPQEWEYLVLLGEISAARGDRLRAELAFDSALDLLSEHHTSIEAVINAEARRFGVLDIQYVTEYRADIALGKSIKVPTVLYPIELRTPPEALRRQLQDTEDRADQVRTRKEKALASTEPNSPSAS